MVGLSGCPAYPWSAKRGFDPWHLAHLSDSMDDIATVRHKPVMIVETDWPQAGTPSLAVGTPEFPFTPDGQAQFYRALIHAVRTVPSSLRAGVAAWDVDTLPWACVFDSRGHALPTVRALGEP